MTIASPPPDRRQRWLWIELIGFDLEAADFGVPAFLDRAGFVPDAVSLLLFNADFVHDHDGLRHDRPFPADICSYAGHPRNSERQRQPWTPARLRALVDELHRHGIAVYPAVFDMFVSQGWIGAHPEVRFVNRHGQLLYSVCPLKRLRDGTWYQDFFAAQLARVLHDYGFDGYHGADGYAHPRIPIYEGDFSDDMVDQFAAHPDADLPADLARHTDGDAAATAARADWILDHRAHAWRTFHVARFQALWARLAAAVHDAGGRVVCNSTWTRDPLEAIYRYGVDYRRLIAAGVDGFVVEAAAAASETERGVAAAGVLHDFCAMLLLLKAYIPDTPLLYLNGVKDTREQWQVLRHTPTALEREIHTLSSLLLTRADGTLQRCADGPVVCLADDILPHEWRWLRQAWDLAADGQPRRTLGATLLTSAAALPRECDAFAAGRRPTTHRLLHSLLACGAPLFTAAPSDRLGVVRGPVVVLNPAFVPAAELALALAYRHGPLLLLGALPHDLPPADLRLTDGDGPDACACALWNAPSTSQAPTLPASPAPAAPWTHPDRDPPSFLDDLAMRPVSKPFLEACAELVRQCARAPRVEDAANAIRVWCVELGPGRLRFLIGNDSHGYRHPRVHAGRRLLRLDTRTPFPLFPVEPTDDTFSVKVPGRGVVVLDADTDQTPGDSA